MTWGSNPGKFLTQTPKTQTPETNPKNQTQAYKLDTLVPKTILNNPNTRVLVGQGNLPSQLLSTRRALRNLRPRGEKIDTLNLADP